MQREQANKKYNCLTLVSDNSDNIYSSSFTMFKFEI